MQIRSIWKALLVLLTRSGFFCRLFVIQLTVTRRYPSDPLRTSRCRHSLSLVLMLDCGPWKTNSLQQGTKTASIAYKTVWKDLFFSPFLLSLCVCIYFWFLLFVAGHRNMKLSKRSAKDVEVPTLAGPDGDAGSTIAAKKERKKKEEASSSSKVWSLYRQQQHCCFLWLHIWCHSIQRRMSGFFNSIVNNNNKSYTRQIDTPWGIRKPNPWVTQFRDDVTTTNFDIPLVVIIPTFYAWLLVLADTP